MTHSHYFVSRYEGNPGRVVIATDISDVRRKTGCSYPYELICRLHDDDSGLNTPEWVHEKRRFGICFSIFAILFLFVSTLFIAV